MATLQTGKMFWYMWDGDVCILEVQSDGSIDSVTSANAGKSLTIWGPKTPDAMDATDLIEENEIGDFVDDAIKYKIMEYIYSRGDNFNPKLVDFAKSAYRSEMRDVRRIAYRRGIETSRETNA